MPKHTRRSRERLPSADSETHHHQHQHLLLEELRAIFRLELADERLASLIIVAAELSADGSAARVAWLCRREDASVALALERAAPFLRARLAEALGWKRIPKLRFISLGVLAEASE